MCAWEPVQGGWGREGQQEDVRNTRAEKAGLENSKALLQLPEAEATGKRICGSDRLQRGPCTPGHLHTVSVCLLPASSGLLGFLIKVSQMSAPQPRGARHFSQEAFGGGAEAPIGSSLLCLEELPLFLGTVGGPWASPKPSEPWVKGGLPTRSLKAFCNSCRRRCHLQIF